MSGYPTANNLEVVAPVLASPWTRTAQSKPNFATIPNTPIDCELSGNVDGDELHKRRDFEEILGSSPELLKLLDRVQSVAPTDANILITTKEPYE